MMNKRIKTSGLYTLIFFSIFYINPVYSKEVYAKQNVIRKQECKNSWKIKPSYLLFQDKTFREILGNGNFMISAEVDFSIVKFCYLFAELGYLCARGHSIPSKVPVSLQMIPFSLGLKGIFFINPTLAFYIKAGPNWIGLKENSDYTYFNQGVFKYTFGATSGVGVLIHIYENFSLDLFSNYIYGRKSYIDKYSNIRIKRYFGGFQFGAGLSFSY